MTYIFSFSSRNSAFRFADAVSALGGYAKPVNAPITTGSGCGMAVKCDDYRLCQNVLNCGHYSNLKRIYSFDGERYELLYDREN